MGSLILHRWERKLEAEGQKLNIRLMAACELQGCRDGVAVQ